MYSLYVIYIITIQKNKYSYERFCVSIRSTGFIFKVDKMQLFVSLKFHQNEKLQVEKKQVKGSALFIFYTSFKNHFKSCSSDQVVRHKAFSVLPDSNLARGQCAINTF